MARRDPRRTDEAFRTVSSRTTSFTGRFAPNGKPATIEITLSSGIGAPLPVARMLTEECRSKPESLDLHLIDPPLAILDLDGDGIDEIIFDLGGNTLFAAAVARIDGCRLVALERSDDPHNRELSYYSHGNCCPESGTGILCRRTADGHVEIVTTAHDSWSPWDYTNPDAPVQRPKTEVPWTRTVYAIRGIQLVAIAKDAGTTKVRDDPSVPLLNRFDCLGSVSP